MFKFLKNKNILFSFVALIFAVLFLVTTFAGNAFVPSNASAANAPSNASQSNQKFTISLYDRATGEESTDYTIENLAFGRAFIYKWSDVNKITFNYNPNIGNAPPKNYEDESVPESEYYDFSISIEYLQGYRDEEEFYQGYLNGYKNIENAFSTTVTGIESYKSLTEFPSSFVFNIDEGRSAVVDEETIRVREWGIYRFKLLINGDQTYSDFFVIEPTTEIEKDVLPAIAYYPTSSNSSLHNDYIFSVTNLEQYQFIDSSKLVWYVTGKSDDGILYILAEEDKTLDQFKDYNYISLIQRDYLRSSRSGLSFRFDDTGVSGSWEIWCEYNYYGSTELPLKSKVIKINTGSQIDYGLIIGIVAGVGIISITLASILAVRRAKKDKVY